MPPQIQASEKDEDAVHDTKHTAYRWNSVAPLFVSALLVFCMYAIFGRHSFSRAPPTNHFWANQSLALSTKAPYPYPPSDHISGTEMPVCYELLQIQQLTRHGARYPNLNEMQRINRVYELLRPVVPPTWIIDDLVDTSKAGLLSRAGEQEIASIAERTMLRYRRIFDKAILNPESVRFVSSDKQRTRVSAQTFRNVLSEDNPRLPQTTVIPQENDTMLSMYHICPAWIRDSQQLKQHDAALETLKFDILYGSQILWMIDFRLGGLRTPLLMGDADVIYRLCGYDLSLYQNDGRWCTLLDQTMSEYFELRRDIEYSRVYGPYGAEVNKRMACVLFTDILADIDSAMANPDSATSTFRFGHAETMSFVSTLLQLEDTLGKVNTPITGNMSLSDALDRGFRTTVLAPFSTNLVIELYRLGRSTGYVRFLLNERVIRLSKCSHDICPLYVLRQMLAAHIGCNFKEICQLD